MTSSSSGSGTDQTATNNKLPLWENGGSTVLHGQCANVVERRPRANVADTRRLLICPRRFVTKIYDLDTSPEQTRSRRRHDSVTSSDVSSSRFAIRYNMSIGNWWYVTDVWGGSPNKRISDWLIVMKLSRYVWIETNRRRNETRLAN